MIFSTTDLQRGGQFGADQAGVQYLHHHGRALASGNNILWNQSHAAGGAETD